MSEMRVELWKQANTVYAKLMDLTVSDALLQLSQMNNLSDELKSLILTLISSGNQSTHYFKKHVGSNFQLENLHEYDFKSGDQIGGYELSDQLGIGGMAQVFKAKKIDAVSQKAVAIKLFNRSDVSAVLSDRFSIEQDVLSGLSHPNIVNMHHGGTTEAGVPYIIMELIEQAEDIDQYAQLHKLSKKEKVRLIVSAARAIAYAHNNLIVHRDIKPSNLLVDGNGQLKVVDFGIAKMMTREDAPQKTTIMALTPSFAAPEQINSDPISVTTDVFSLAAVCLSLIIEDLPLPADRLLKSCNGDEAHIWQILKSKLSDKDLQNILNKALQQNPEKRYRNMDLFADDLSAWLVQKPVQATSDSWAYRITKFAQRRKALFAALSTLLVMAVLGVALLSWQVSKTQAEAQKANEVKDFMLNVFSVVSPDEAQGENILAKDLLAQAFAEIQARDFQDINTKTELLITMGQAQLQLGLNQSAGDSFAVALEVDPNSTLAHLGELKIMMGKDDFPGAVDKIALIDLLIKEESPLSRAELLLLKAQLAIDTSKDYALAKRLTMDAQLVFQKEENFKGYFTADRQLANILHIQSLTEEAVSLLEKQLVLAQQRLAPTHTVVLAIKNDLVDFYNDIGNYPKAIKHASQLIEGIKKVLGERHPFLIQAYLSQASTQRGTGDIKKAKTSVNLALSLSRELNGELHKSTASAINFIAILHFVDNEIDQALEKTQLASNLYEQIYGEDHPDTWTLKADLAVMLDMVDRMDEAIEIIEPVLRKQTDILGVGHKSTIYSQSVLIRLYAGVGRLDEAQVLGEDSMKQAIAALGADHSITAGSQFSLAKIYQQQGNYTAGINLIQSIINADSWDEESNERAISAYNTLADMYLGNEDILSATVYKEKSLAMAVKLLTEESPRTWVQMLKSLEFYITVKDAEKAEAYIKKLSVIFDQNETVNERLLTRFEEMKADAEGIN